MQLAIGNIKISTRTAGLHGILNAASAVSSTIFYPGHVTVERVTLNVPALPSNFDGLRIAHISDFHVDEWLKHERLVRAMQQVSELNADLILITGDFTSDIDAEIAADITKGLQHLHAREGIFAVLGNHDYRGDTELVAESIQAAGVNLLRNAHMTVQRDGQTLYIAGVDDIYMDKHDLDAALAGIPTDACALLMAHEPDYADEVAADGRVAVQFSGHSHGGQFRLPLIGVPWLPPMGRNYVRGAYQIDELQLYVTRGLGVTGIAARINCPAEITEITLRCE